MIRHHNHVQSRLLERYDIKASGADLEAVEEAFNTLDRDHFIRRDKEHVDEVLFEWRGRIVHALVSRPAYQGNKRHLLTVLPAPERSS